VVDLGRQSQNRAPKLVLLALASTNIQLLMTVGWKKCNDKNQNQSVRPERRVQRIETSFLISKIADECQEPFLCWGNER
jgi:hypothetical protein